MSDDIFHSWKSTRFIVANYALLNEPELFVVLTDFEFWVENLDELILWCQEHGAHQKGMTVSFDTQEQLTLFALRWS